MGVSWGHVRRASSRIFHLSRQILYHCTTWETLWMLYWLLSWGLEHARYLFFFPVLWFFDLQNSCIINLLIVLTGILGWYVSLYTISWHTGKYLVAKLCLTLLQPHRLDCSLPGKNTGVHYNFLPQDIFPAHRLNPHCRWILYCWATREA